MPFNVRSRVVAYAALILFTPLALEAQGSAAVVPRADSSATLSRPTINPWPQRVWISVGAGVGSLPYGSLDGVATAWYSVGPFATGARLGAAGQWIGEQRSDQAFLIGARTPGSRVFLLGAVGTAKVKSSRTCDDCGTTSVRSATTETAYSVEAHGNPVPVFGVGATMFGVLGPASVHYNAFALTLDVGWFGPW